jgi:hypothetical protein
MLMTNILTLVLLVMLLTIVPMVPGFVMSKFLSAGLAVQERTAQVPVESSLR